MVMCECEGLLGSDGREGCGRTLPLHTEQRCCSVAVILATFRCSVFFFLREEDILVADILTVSVWHVVG